MVTEFYMGRSERKWQFKNWKLIIHVFNILHGGELNENENIKKENYVFYVCRMSNVENGQKNALNSVKSPFSAYLI